MISRIWHGWTTPGNADRYEELLKKEIFAEIAAKNVQGYRGIQLFRRSSGAEVEFVTVMWFESLADVRQFIGNDDYEQCYVPAAARTILSRFDERSLHYEVKAQHSYP